MTIKQLEAIYCEPDAAGYSVHDGRRWHFFYCLHPDLGTCDRCGKGWKIDDENPQNEREIWYSKTMKTALCSECLSLAADRSRTRPCPGAEDLEKF